MLIIYPALAVAEYLKQHNSAALLIHKQIFEFYGDITCEKPWPQPVV